MNEMTNSMTSDMSYRCGEHSATGRAARHYPGNQLRSAADALDALRTVFIGSASNNTVFACAG